MNMICLVLFEMINRIFGPCFPAICWRASRGDGRRVLAAHARAVKDVTETCRIHVVLFGMQNRNFIPYLSAINRMLAPGPADAERRPGC
jgi:hypothetical protein